MKHISQAMEQSTNTGFKIKQEFVRQYQCDGCGKTVDVYKTLIPGGPRKGEWVEGTFGCDCEALGMVKQNQREAKKARTKSIFADNSLISPALKKANFDNFDAHSDDLKKALLKTKRYVDDFKISEPTSLFFQGNFGTGKSHLSVSITKALRDKGYSVIFISIPKLLTKIRNTYNKSSEQSEDQILNTLASVDLVAFDDIGAEGEIKGWGMQKIFEVIDQRGGKHNIFTTNLSSQEFESSKELARIFSRLMMDAEPVIMNGEDYRKRHFKKEA
jgi:DNA replication protein DnaC